MTTAESPMPAPQTATEASVPLSQILRALCSRPGEELSIGEIVENFGGRAFGAVIFVLAIPILLPFPPGLAGILGLPLLLIAPQLVLGVGSPWLPRVIARRTVRAADLRRAFVKVLPWIERLEAISRPRLGWMFGPLGDRMTGLLVTILTLLLILPIPLGNVLPTMAIGLLALALIQEDGILALIGTVTGLISVAVIAAAAGAAGRGLHHLVSLVAGA